MTLLYIELQRLERLVFKFFERVKAQLDITRLGALYVLEVVEDGLERRRTCRPLRHAIIIDGLQIGLERGQDIVVRVADPPIRNLMLLVRQFVSERYLRGDQLGLTLKMKA